MTTQSQPQSKQQSTTAVAQLKKFQEETANKVMEQVNALQDTGELVLPKDYIPGNAMKLAWLKLQELTDKNDKPVLEVCSRESICNALLEMVIKGLSVAKSQCYFIAYNGKLTCQEDYRGSLLIAKRDAGVKECNSNIIYQGDEFQYEVDTTTGRMKIIKHTPVFENMDNDKIRGAYAVVLFEDGSSLLEVMNINQIRQSWLMGNANGNSKAHRNFTDQMAKKTVIN